MTRTQAFVLSVSLAAVSVSVALAADYTGTLTVYMVEPKSRWADATSQKYAFGFLDYATEQPLTVIEKTRWTAELSFNAVAAGYPDVEADNIQATVVITTDESVESDANPPLGAWFDAYYVDAAAEARADSVGWNETPSGFSHTVFIEEATETG